MITERGPKDKTAVMGILERGGKVRVHVVSNRKKHLLETHVRAHVKAGSAIYSDNFASYDRLNRFSFQHSVVDHAEKYVDGQVHTNGLENFWSLVKRGLKGTYVAVEPFHLDRYIAEQVFRYNNRATKDNPLTDSDRFALAVNQITGKRLTFAELTGKEDSGTGPF